MGCEGNKRGYQGDGCSFKTLLGRVLLGNYWIDLYEFYYDSATNAPKPAEPITETQCFPTPKKHMYCTYIPGSMAMVLPKTHDCICGGVQLRCLPRNVIEDVLASEYPGFIKPDKMWNGSDYSKPTTITPTTTKTRTTTTPTTAT